VRDVLGAPFEVKLALWYGWNVALALSAATVALGLTVYARRVPVRALVERAVRALPATADSLYEDALELLRRGAGAQTRWLMGGGATVHLLVILGTAGLLVWTALGASGGLAAPPLPRADWVAWLLAAVVVVEAIGAVVAGTRLAGAAALGAMGFAVALLFLMAGAPDLAITQFLVETLIVLVLVLVLRRLPRVAEAPAPVRRRAVAGTVALTVGAGFTALMLGVVGRPFDPALAEFFSAASVPDGKGRNIVNVILVDFRALDTLGEIAVLGVAALGVLVLVDEVFPSAGASRAGGGADRGRPGLESPVLTAVARFLVPLLVLFSLFLLWRGHNEPGGGFIAGLVAAGALALRVLASGSSAGRALLRLRPRTWIGAGLLLALASGLAGPLAGSAFMTGLWTELPLPGEALKLGTPLLFDLGVFALVLGFTATVLVALEERNG
jgi:multicomponent Na+:H+ antiporter subunit A